MAHEAVLKEVAKSKLRLSCNCADVQVGGAVFSIKLRVARRRHGGAGRRRYLTATTTGVTAKFQSQTFKVARYCGREKVDVQDAGEVGWDLALGDRRLGMTRFRWNLGRLKGMIGSARSGMVIGSD